jgi:hypothetical protein
VWLAFLLALCGVASAADDAPPRRKAALVRWLAAGSYRRAYLPEPAAHPSAGPHGARVRTWYGPTLVDDLRAGRSGFRKGAAMVKELDPTEGGRPGGWAVMRKLRTRSGRTGRGWLFYEAFDATGKGAVFGRGKALCTGCHRQGVDYLRSEFRP